MDSEKLSDVHLRELTVKALFEPDHEAAITEAASAFATNVGSLVVTDPELHIYTPQENTDEQEREEVLALLEKRMDEAGFNDKERAVTRLNLLDMTYSEISQKLLLSEAEVKKFVKKAMNKCGSRTRVGLSSYVLGLAKGSGRAALIAAATKEARSPKKPDFTSDKPITPSTKYDQVIKHYGLSQRQGEVVLLAKKGLSNIEIGHELHLAEATIKDYLSTAYAILGIKKRSQISAKFEDSTQVAGPRLEVVDPPETHPTPHALWEAARDYWIKGNPLTKEELATLNRFAQSRLLDYGAESNHIDAVMLAAEGLEYKQIAGRLGVSSQPIRKYTKHAITLAGQDSRQGLVHHILEASLKEVISLTLGPYELSGHTPEQRSDFASDILNKRRLQCMRHFRLTAKEQQVAKECAVQATLSKVAETLTISPQTLDGYKRQVFEKTKVNNNRVRLLRKIYGIDPS